MTLTELIQEYKTEAYKFWKYRDTSGREITTHFFFSTHSDYLNKYLGFYKELPSLTEVVIYAADGIFKIDNKGVEYSIRHNHQEVFTDKEGNQRGVPYEISRQVRDNLTRRTSEIASAQTFDEIFNIVAECRVRGFGELSIYDTSMRIATYMNIEPDKIYLHAGARKGLEILEEKGYIERGSSKEKYIEIINMPKPMQQLKADETEHLLCSMKDRMHRLEKAI